MWDTREVYKVEVYARVRRAVQVDGMSIRQAAREFGLARKTIRKMLAVFAAAGLRTEEAGSAAEAGPLAGDHRSDPVGRPDAAEETAAYRQTDLGPA